VAAVRAAAGRVEIIEAQFIPDAVTYLWRGPLTDAEMVELVKAHGGKAVSGWREPA
jgi:hypothetical protein